MRKEFLEINLAKIAKDKEGQYVAFNTDDLDPDDDIDHMVFLFHHKNGNIVINLGDVLRCLRIAEENNYLPPHDEKWWIKAINGNNDYDGF